jgi:hypothetical protein
MPLSPRGRSYRLPVCALVGFTVFAVAQTADALPSQEVADRLLGAGYPDAITLDPRFAFRAQSVAKVVRHKSILGDEWWTVHLEGQAPTGPLFAKVVGIREGGGQIAALYRGAEIEEWLRGGRVEVPNTWGRSLRINGSGAASFIFRNGVFMGLTYVMSEKINDAFGVRDPLAQVAIGYGSAVAVSVGEWAVTRALLGGTLTWAAFGSALFESAAGNAPLVVMALDMLLLEHLLNNAEHDKRDAVLHAFVDEAVHYPGAPFRDPSAWFKILQKEADEEEEHQRLLAEGKLYEPCGDLPPETPAQAYGRRVWRLVNPRLRALGTEQWQKAQQFEDNLLDGLGQCQGTSL